MLDTTKILIEAMEITNVCSELRTICLAYKDSNLELFNYYKSFLEWMLERHEFARSEAKKLIDLQNEIWYKERIEREERMKELKLKKLIETTETTKTARKPTIIKVHTKCKELFGKVSEFEMLGYKFFFCFEVSKV